MPKIAMIARLRAGAFLTSVLLAGCQAVPSPRAAPPPPTPPAPKPTPAPTPATPSNLDWEEAPVAPGTWTYLTQDGVKAASFGQDIVVIGCRPATRQIELSVRGVAPVARAMTVRTSFGALQWAGVVTSPAASGVAMLTVSRPASDPGFDQIAYSRGRIAIEVAGRTRLIVPAWAEISRVIEDCRN
ncbi:hypothetical protein [Sphingobium nicotianae]|uniref:Uncharacterized protein n=1 Tax=Sphingobium nicotianae TaxID=2782607 RepID=A0A9X1DFA5_9SPHN|nr:hypothetical protein [Sphingobium nicotianae]MBT2188418.1 hypothetical protein [Sphingobium nicotianae]